MNLSYFLPLCGFFLGFSNLDSSESGKGTLAVPSNDFLNSIGANSAISSRAESLEKTVELIRYTGIRWIRSGYEGNVPMSDYLSLHRQTGIKFSYGLMSGGTDISRLLEGARTLAAAGALLAFEGVNEPNNWSLTYEGKQGGGQHSWLPVAQLQRDLYQSVKRDPELKAFPVWSLCENGAQTDNTGLQFLKIPEAAGTILPPGTVFADYATCHNYFLHPSNPYLYDNQTWNAADPGPACKVDGLYGNYGLTWARKFQGYSDEALKNLPRVTTETGVTIDGEFTEEKQARLYLNVYLAQFKRNWAYTAMYLLRDRSDEAGNQSFGFYDKDYKPRKSAIYLHNMTTILADHSSSDKLNRLNYRIPEQPETVHDLLLQNSKGKFQLLVWGEKARGTESVTLDLGRTFKTVRIFDPTQGTEARQTLHGIRNTRLTLSDHPLIVELSN